MKLRIIVLFLLLTCCKEQKIITDSLLPFLPNNAVTIIKINNLSNFRSELKNNTFLSITNETKLHKTIIEKIEGLSYLNTEASCLLAFYELGKDNFEFVMVLENNPELFDIDTETNTSVETLTYENTTVKKYGIANTTLFSVAVEDHLIASSAQMLLENVIRTGYDNQSPETLSKLYDASDITKSATIFINFKQAQNLIGSNLNTSSKINPSSLTNWVSVDFTSNQNKLVLSGISIANDSVKNAINLFKGTTPLNDAIAILAPKNADAILSYAFENYDEFAKNQRHYLDQAKVQDTIFNTIEEVGIIYLKNEKAVVLNSFGAESLSDNITGLKTGSFDYQGSEIWQLNNPKLVSEIFKPLVTNFDANFCTIIGNSFIFSATKEVLQNIIANHKSGTTFDKTAIYTTAKSALANESSVLFIASENGIDHFLEQDFSDKLFTDFENLDIKDYAFAAQIVADQSFYHINMLASTIKKEVANNSISPLFTVELDTDLAMPPKFVKNHRTNKQEIVVQDKDHFLYLISTEGKVLWKKQLESQIRGEIQQVDLYKNGKLQLAFCTSNQFLILDRNGEEVAPFNIKFESGNLNGLAVFDYENTKNYRFVVTQGRKIFMYNAQGKIVDGFTYKEASSPIIKTPKHFRLSKKDYLVFTLEDKTMTIRHRAGQERIKVSTKIDFSDNEVFLYKNKFSVTDKKGVLHQIDTKGKLAATNFNLSKEHGMFATSKTLALMNENILSIKGKKVELDLGVYTAPKIFYLYDKIYVSITDIQNQQIYLFDSQAEPIANFPVFGNSLLDLTDMDGDKKLEFVAKDQENSIIVYKMN